MGHLTITFAGICTHYRNLAPNVPHRVVLPYGGAFRFGLLQDAALADVMDPVAYYIQPHFAIIQTSTTGSSPTVPGIMTDGYLYVGAHMAVPNAITELRYTQSYQQLTSLADFVPDFRYSNDVVLGGNAICYFDLDRGVISASTPPGRATSVTLETDTTGPPVLRLTPFASGSQSIELSLDDSAAIVVANVELQPDPPTRLDEHMPFDFLLHYLSAAGGIPQKLMHPTPGLDQYDRVPLTKFMLKDALDALGEWIAESDTRAPTPFGPSGEMVRKFDYTQLDPSCSDSGYP